MEAKQIINGHWERALALTFQLKQIIIRGACVDRVQLKHSGAGGACQEIAPTETHPHLEPCLPGNWQIWASKHWGMENGV